MNKLKIFSLYLLALTLFTVACKKDDDKDDPSKKELLSKTWKVQQVTKNDNVDTDDYSASSFTFNSAGNYSIQLPEGNETGAWVLNSAGNQVTLTPSGGTAYTADILKLDASSLTLQIKKKNYKSGDITVVYKLIP